MLLGSRIYLRLMEEKDIPYKVNWINDPEVRKTLNFDYPISEIGTRHWLNQVALDNSRRDFIVCLIKDDVPIGYGGLLNIDIKNSKAESYIGIGDMEYWGKGYGKEVMHVLLSYAFHELGLNRVYSFVWPKNERMINLNISVGLEIEGLLKADVFSHGEYRDRYIMSILRDNYLKNTNESSNIMRSEHHEEV